MLGCLITPANTGDREGAKRLMRRLWLKYPDLHVFADGGYDGPLVEWAKNCYGYTLEVVVKPKEQRGFSVLCPTALARRWVVERTFAWLGQWRRLAKDYEQSPCSAGAFMQIAMIGLMLNRIDP